MDPTIKMAVRDLELARDHANKNATAAAVMALDAAWGLVYSAQRKEREGGRRMVVGEPIGALPQLLTLFNNPPVRIGDTDFTLAAR